MSIEAIKEALKDGPTEGSWKWGTYAIGVLVVTEERGKHDPITQTGDASCCAVPWDSTESSKQAQIDADYIAACNPVAIRELIERLEAAEKDAARLDLLDSFGYAYGFQDMHEGNAWEIRGPFANVRAAIDSAMSAANEN